MAINIYNKIKRLFIKKLALHYIKKLDLKKLGLENYQSLALQRFIASFNFTNKRVLEIGGSNIPTDITDQILKVRQWVCVDNLPTHYDYKKSSFHYARETILDLSQDSKIPDSKYVIFNGRVENIPPSFYDKFDLAISLCAFEHFIHLTTVLEIAYKCLKNDGMLFAEYGPIFSCACGHHCWVSPQLNFNQPQSIPRFAHLLYSPEQLRAYYGTSLEAQELDMLIDQLYHSDRINRLFYEDYIDRFNNSQFKINKLRSVNDLPVSPDEYARLIAKYPPLPGHERRDFSTYSMYVELEKTGAKS